MARRRRGRAVDGILLLDKPAGITSTDALNRAKRVFDARRAGHTGSLDPLASGLLPITFGEATKLSAFLLNAGKRYRVEASLGVATETGDADGAVRAEAPVPGLSDAVVESVLAGFRGEIEQIPPMYSALKYKGERLYSLARRGVTVEREPRTVTIHELRLVGREAERLFLEVRCSKGTYVRTLIEDIGVALGTLAHVSALRRTGVAGFDESDHLVPLETLESDAEPGRFLLPVDAALRDWPAVALNRELAYFVRHGQPVLVPRAPGSGWLRLYDESNRFVGVGEMLDDGRIAPRRLMGGAAA
jgi:tRNA pseudouridine55 synthase